MGRLLRSERALQRSALSLLGPLLLGLLLLGWGRGATAEPCRADRYDEEAQVALVSDGDTIRLSDGRKVRLLGINAPEVAHDGKPGQPLGEEARNFLSRQLEGTATVRLRFESERSDRYGRLLAHLYLMDGSSLQERLLGAGLAQQLVVPPNSWQSGCYREVERKARSKHMGLWANRYYFPLDRAPAEDNDNVFRLISGTVSRVGQSRKSLWLNLDNSFAVRIDRHDWPRFEGMDLLSLKGKRVVVRGWLQRVEGRYQVTVRDPTALMSESEW